MLNVGENCMVNSWKWFSLLVAFSLLALILFVWSVACTPENPNDLSDTSGIPTAYMFATILMICGFFSWGVSLAGLLACIFVSSDRAKLRFFISCIANVPWVLTAGLGVFSVAAFSYDSIVGVLSGTLFSSVAICLCMGLFRMAKPKPTTA